MNAKYEPNDLLTCQEAAVEGGVNPRTIASWIRRGWLPAEKSPGLRGRYKIKYKDLMDVAHRPYVPEGKEHGAPQGNR